MKSQHYIVAAIYGLLFGLVVAQAVSCERTAKLEQRVKAIESRN